ncbi:MAG TPA: carboxypeptidase regulatory-like domain-containing protein [Geobacteraceae bacterium]
MRCSVGNFFLAVVGMTVVLLSSLSCAPRNPHEAAGFFRPAVLSRACIAGKVTDAVTGRGIDGAHIEVESAIPVIADHTDHDGNYYAEFPGGNYRLRFGKAGYQSAEKTVQLKPGETVGLDIRLEPRAKVVVNAGNPVTGVAPEGTVTVEAAVIIRDGSVVKGIRWKLDRDEVGIAAKMRGENGPAVTVKLPDVAVCKNALLKRLRKDGRLLDRWMVLGIAPSDLREAGNITLTAIATTSTGTYSDTVHIFADLKDLADVNPGLQNVAVGRPVLLQGKQQPSYRWSLAAPPGSAVVLKDGATRNPYFTPDAAGAYTVREGDKERLTIYAGHWQGIVAAEEIGLSEVRRRSGSCLCHEGGPIAPKFVAWRASGHAEIFTQCVNTVFRYEESCFACHMVGFGVRKADGGGSTQYYRAFLKDAAFWDHGKIPPIVKPRPGNYDAILLGYPDVARFANVQCESCHGPNDSEVHQTLKKTGAPERISLQPEVCGTCHGDSKEEASYRQWHVSKHSNYDRAVAAGTIEKNGETAGDCGRCHTGQGFLAWLARGDRLAPLVRPGTGFARDGLIQLGLTEDKVQPVTCAVCHDPHGSGNSFRSRTTKVPVREVANSRMLPREFKGDTVARDALCLICHSTVSGPYNDGTTPRMSGDTAPHAAQGDVLFGQNAFFASTGTHKDHARKDRPDLVEDTCIWCHVKPVPKLSEQGYPRKWVNHTFKSDSGTCFACHKKSGGDELMSKFVTKGDLGNLKKKVEDAVSREIGVTGVVRLVGAASGAADVSLRPPDIQELFLLDLDGKMGVKVTTTANEVYTVSLSRVSPGDVPLTETDNGQVILKAAWNYFLLKNDGSQGVHNPTFVKEVLSATGEKLRALHPVDRGPSMGIISSPIPASGPWPHPPRL